MAFTKENARLMQQKSVQARNAAKFTPEPEPTPVQANPQLADAFALTLDHACESVLAELLKAKQPIAKAQLARCLRDLRETWHLATGKPRPGLTRPDMARQPRREIPRSVHPMFTGESDAIKTP